MDNRMKILYKFFLNEIVTMAGNEEALLTLLSEDFIMESFTDAEKTIINEKIGKKVTCKNLSDFIVLLRLWGGAQA